MPEMNLLLSSSFLVAKVHALSKYKSGAKNLGECVQFVTCTVISDFEVKSTNLM